MKDYDDIQKSEKDLLLTLTRTFGGRTFTFLQIKKNTFTRTKIHYNMKGNAQDSLLTTSTRLIPPLLIHMHVQLPTRAIWVHRNKHNFLECAAKSQASRNSLG